MPNIDSHDVIGGSIIHPLKVLHISVFAIPFPHEHRGSHLSYYLISCPMNLCVDTPRNCRVDCNDNDNE